MIAAEVKGLYSLEVNNLEQYMPDPPDVFLLHLRAIVGPKGAPGEESFDIKVCTPGWLASRCENEDFVVGRHYLIVARYDFSALKRIIVKLIEGCSGNSWQEVAQKVARIGYWEFEDYQPAN
jgi:hypothetical protein